MIKRIIFFSLKHPYYGKLKLLPFENFLKYEAKKFPDIFNIIQIRFVQCELRHTVCLKMIWNLLGENLNKKNFFY